MGGTGRPLGKTFFLHCQRRHPELPKIPTYLLAIHTDASDHGIGAVLKQEDEQGNSRSCAFFSRKLQGSVKSDADGNVLGYMGQRAWSVRVKETYALVSCLLNFKSWISGRQVTVFTDHKFLESWYTEELCTMAGPLGRRGRWHEFFSRYNMVVVYKQGVENDAADGMSRWAYPAGLADEQTFTVRTPIWKG